MKQHESYRDATRARQAPFEQALAGLDARQERLTGRTLADSGLSWKQRVDEVTHRLHAAVNLAYGDHPLLPDLVLIEQAGAHLLALHQAIVDAQTVRVDTGEAA